MFEVTVRWTTDDFYPPHVARFEDYDDALAHVLERAWVAGITARISSGDATLAELETHACAN